MNKRSGSLDLYSLYLIFGVWAWFNTMGEATAVFRWIENGFNIATILGPSRLLVNKQGGEGTI